MWRYLSAKSDVNFAYVPAIRRVRRMSPANRSDGFVGSDFSVDDILAYDGKIPHFEWKLRRARKMRSSLSPARSPLRSMSPTRVSGKWPSNHPYYPVWPRRRELAGRSVVPPQSDLHQAAGLVLEAKAKDPYYNYGLQYIWVTADTWGPAYKMVHDRSGKFWKFMSVTTAGFRDTATEGVKFLAWLDHMVVDSTQGARHHRSPSCIRTPFSPLTPCWT